MKDDFPFYQFARLVRQAHLEGASIETLRLVIEAAADAGANRALARAGLHDCEMKADMDELRELLAAWRDVKRTARRTVVRWCTGALLMLLAAGIAIKARLLVLS